MAGTVGTSFLAPLIVAVLVVQSCESLTHLGRYRLLSVCVAVTAIAACAQDSLSADIESAPAELGSPTQPFVGEPVIVTEPRYSPREAFYASAPVATNGDDYLVVVSDLVDPKMESVRIASDGTVDVYPTVIDDDRCLDNQLFWTGTDYILFCRDRGGLFGYRLTREGAAGDRIVLRQDEEGTFFLFNVAQAGNHYLLAWTVERSTIMGWLIRDDGDALEPLSEEPFPIGVGNRFRQRPHVIWLEDAFLVVYEDDRFTDVPSVDLRSTRVALDGTVENVDGNVLVASPDVDEYAATLVAGDRNALLVYSVPGDIHSVILDQNGEIIEGTTRAHPPQFGFGLIPAGAAYTGESWLIKGQTANSFSLVPVDPTQGVRRVFDSIPGLASSWIAWRGETGLLVGSNPSLHEGPVESQLLDANGVADEPRFVLQEPLAFRDSRLASDGEGYLAWYGQGGVAYARFMGPQGTRDGDEPSFDGFVRAPRALGSIGGNYLVANYDLGLRGYTVAPDSEILSAFYVSGGSAGYDVGRSEDGYLVALIGDGPRAVRLDRNGRSIERTPVRLSSNPARATAVTVAGIADRYLLAYTREANTFGPAGLYALRVAHQDLEVLDRDAILISPSPAAASAIKVIAAGDVWVVAWLEDSGVGVASLDVDGEVVRAPRCCQRLVFR